MELPPHPETDDAGDPGRTTAVSWGAVLGVVVVAVLLAGLVILHLAGVVGPRAH